MRLLLVTRRRAVAIEGDRIVAPEGAFDLVLDLGDAEIRPGLINAHDHLHRNHYGRLGHPPYANAYRWAEDIQRRHRHRIATGRALARRSALLEGAWKNLFAGVTCVVHHDRWEPDFDLRFPIKVARVPSADSLGMTPSLAAPVAGPWCLHLAEGVDAAAADEIRLAEARGLLGPQLIAVHGVGSDRDGIARLRTSGAGLVWCPSSNLFLFGRTAPAALLAPGIDVLLGSDSRLTGVGDLLDELRLARRLDLVEPARLAAAVGKVAAARLGLSEPVLEPGASADLVVLGRPLLDARTRDVRLVLVDGSPRIATAGVAARFAGRFGEGRLLRRGGVTRWTPEWAHAPAAHPLPRALAATALVP